MITRMLFVYTGVLLGVLLAGHADADSRAAIEAAVAGDHRPEAHTARDQYRHPVETLVFFGIEPDMNVLEIWPGGRAWYTEILAPLLREDGELIAAGQGPASYSHQLAQIFKRNDAGFAEKMAANPEIYDRVSVVELWAPDELDIAPDQSLDMIVTFRNLHNWLMWDQAEATLAAFYRALKPGGILGVTDHRAEPSMPLDPNARSGYVDEAFAIKVIQSAGFRLVDSADINDNPSDRKNYERGVWTLPPVLATGTDDEKHDEYLAIGESDRFTLKFVKPE